VLLDADLDEAVLVLLRSQPPEEQQPARVEIPHELAWHARDAHAEVRSGAEAREGAALVCVVTLPFVDVALALRHAGGDSEMHPPLGGQGTCSSRLGGWFLSFVWDGRRTCSSVASFSARSSSFSSSPATEERQQSQTWKHESMHGGISP